MTKTRKKKKKNLLKKKLWKKAFNKLNKQGTLNLITLLFFKA